ncbi:hypothetical protein B9Z55_012717 [Caenorhabditis nigoni]|uniref:Homeobox domain-containing protein n=1 Tax=Caenorhabditis nigoni TaxID=1611254 RepID=A0A2G5TZI8_9PELO|nr:hypothetical protein B9Z55_012717 [Caenorhabditis nigoni]
MVARNNAQKSSKTPQVVLNVPDEDYYKFNEKFKEEHVKIMLEVFSENRYLSAEKADQLSKEFYCDTAKLRNWFSHRRQTVKKSQQTPPEEILTKIYETDNFFMEYGTKELLEKTKWSEEKIGNWFTQRRLRDGVLKETGTEPVLESSFLQHQFLGKQEENELEKTTGISWFIMNPWFKTKRQHVIRQHLGGSIANLPTEMMMLKAHYRASDTLDLALIRKIAAEMDFYEKDITDYFSEIKTAYQELMEQEKEADVEDMADAPQQQEEQDRLDNVGRSIESSNQEGTDGMAQDDQEQNTEADYDQSPVEADEVEYDEEFGALPDWEYLNAHYSRNAPNVLVLETQNVPEFVNQETVSAPSSSKDSVTEEGSDQDIEILGILPRPIVVAPRIKVEGVQDIVPQDIESPAPPERIVYEIQDRLLEYQEEEHAPGPIPLRRVRTTVGAICGTLVGTHDTGFVSRKQLQEYKVYDPKTREPLVLPFNGSTNMSDWSRCQVQEFLCQILPLNAAKWIASKCLEEIELLLFEPKTPQFFKILTSLASHENQEISWEVYEEISREVRKVRNVQLGRN